MHVIVVYSVCGNTQRLFQPASCTLMSSNEPRGRGSHREASAENDDPYVPQIFLQCARTYASSTASAALVLRSVCERWPPRLTTGAVAIS